MVTLSKIPGHPLHTLCLFVLSRHIYAVGLELPLSILWSTQLCPSFFTPSRDLVTFFHQLHPSTRVNGTSDHTAPHVGAFLYSHDNYDYRQTLSKIGVHLNNLKNQLQNFSTCTPMSEWFTHFVHRFGDGMQYSHSVWFISIPESSSKKSGVESGISVRYDSYRDSMSYHNFLDV